MPRRRRAFAEELLDRVEQLGVIVVINADLDESARCVGWHRALEDVTALDDRLDVGRAHGVLGDGAADFARGMLAGFAPGEPEE